MTAREGTGVYLAGLEVGTDLDTRLSANGLDASDPGLLGLLGCPRSLSRTFIVKYAYTFSL